MNAILKKGSRGEQVIALQRKLNLIADGIFGSVTEEAVRAFQKAHGLSADGIAGPKTLAALGLGAGTRRIDTIIVHCTATPEGEDFSVDQIRRMHLANGWSDIGYHWLIGRDGTIHRGRDEKLIGAHCAGHNTGSIGISYVGGCAPRSERDWQRKCYDTRTVAQKRSMLRLIKEIRGRYEIKGIYGHRDFSAKPCPGFDARTEYRNA